MKKFLWILLIVPTLSWADSYVVSIEGMHCESCAKSITENLTKTFQKEKIENVNVDFSSKKANFQAKTIEKEKIKKTIEALGYTVKSVDVTPTP
jgi:copper chaperone CopZ